MSRKAKEELIGDIGVIAEKKDLFGVIVTVISVILIVLLIFLGAMAYITSV